MGSTVQATPGARYEIYYLYPLTEQQQARALQFVRILQAAYLDAGADVITTNTFNANAISLADYALEPYADEINRAAASIAVQTLGENRAVGLTVSSRRQHIIQPDRGTRVEQKILHLLANVQADGGHSLAEVLTATLPQLRRGMTLCIITGSTDRTWVRGLTALRRRGVAALVILLDRASYIGVEPDEQSRAELAAVRHALAEYDITHRLVRRGDDIADAIGGRTRARA